MVITVVSALVTSSARPWASTMGSARGDPPAVTAVLLRHHRLFEGHLRPADRRADSSPCPAQRGRRAGVDPDRGGDRRPGAGAATRLCRGRQRAAKKGRTAVMPDVGATSASSWRRLFGRALLRAVRANSHADTRRGDTDGTVTDCVRTVAILGYRLSAGSRIYRRLTGGRGASRSLTLTLGSNPSK